MNYLISVITINLNNLEGLQKNISSVLRQDYINIEYLIIDGGSNDGSVEYIKSNEHICFIRVGYVSYDEIYNFNEAIKHINPECDFTLVVIDNNENNNTELFKQKNLLYFKLNIDIPSNNDADIWGWTESYLNWNKIFLDIENNL